MGYISNVDRDIVFLDSETGGLDAQFHDAIEWAAIRVAPDGTEKAVYESKVRVDRPERLEPKAIEVNGYTPEAWADAPPEFEVVKKMAEICDGAILVGQNVSFDENFLEAALKRHGMKKTWHYHKLDTMNLAWPLIKAGVISGMSLVNLCEWAGVVQVKPHRALADARCVQTVYNKLMAHYAAGNRGKNALVEAARETQKLDEPV